MKAWSRPMIVPSRSGRGLLDETLVLWAGGGVRGGISYGATDEFGYRAVEKVVKMPDLHATMLRLLGIDHERLTFLHGGHFPRLTDVHGPVIRDVLA